MARNTISAGKTGRHRQKWGGRWGSNPRPPESQSGALPAELRPPLISFQAAPVPQEPCARPTHNAFGHSTKSCPVWSVIGAPGRTRTCNPQLRRLMPHPFDAPLSPAQSDRAPPASLSGGAPGRTRTCNPQLRRLMLYPLSYGRSFSGTTRYTSSEGARFQIVGRGGRIRTADPLLPKQLRYQAALHPECQCPQFNSNKSRPRHEGPVSQKRSRIILAPSIICQPNRPISRAVVIWRKGRNYSGHPNRV